MMGFVVADVVQILLERLNFPTQYEARSLLYLSQQLGWTLDDAPHTRTYGDGDQLRDRIWLEFVRSAWLFPFYMLSSP